VLHTRSDGFAGSRAPLQIGAEIFGHDGVESDVEVLRLLVATLETAGIDNAYLDLGHVGIYRALAAQAGLDRAQEMALFDALQRKAIPEIRELIDRAGVAPAVGDMLLALPELNGDDALERAGDALAKAAASVQSALARLRAVADDIARWLPSLSVHFDLAELRGYNYKTGIVFAAFVPGWGLEIGRGGRYDDIGLVFGRSRPAVGFSTDLKGLIAQAPPAEAALRPPVLAPWSADPSLQAEVRRLRQSGRRVIYRLPGAANTAGSNAEQLVQDVGGWALKPVTET
jgi:ATP phosphoribosyltransferase regulatory subunit